MPTKKIETTSEKENHSSANGSSRLYRSETNKIIGGVCGGIGEYFNIDPTIIRLIFVLITLFGGSGILVYIILWLVIPSESSLYHLPEEHIKENAKEMRERAQKFAHDIKFKKSTTNGSNKAWWGLIIILLGLIFLLSNYGYYDFYQFSRLWPIILIGFGLLILFRKR